MNTELANTEARLGMSAGQVGIGQLKCSIVLCKSMNNHKSNINIDSEVTNKFQQLGDFANMKPVNNEDHCFLCFSKHVKN